MEKGDKSNGLKSKGVDSQTDLVDRMLSGSPRNRIKVEQAPIVDLELRTKDYWGAKSTKETM